MKANCACIYQLFSIMKGLFFTSPMPGVISVAANKYKLYVSDT